MIIKLLNFIKNENKFVLCDIGAMGGIPKIWKTYEKFLKIIAFEPDDREFTKLVSKENLLNLNYVLAESSKDIDYYITTAHGKSSNIQPNLDLLAKYPCFLDYEVQRKIKLNSSKVTSLDILRQNALIPEIDFIKVDTQGSELSILKGGSNNILKNLLGIQIEVEFIPLYKNQPLFRNVDEFLDSNNFQLIDLKRYYWKRSESQNTRGKGEIIFGDALYFIKIEKFQELITTIEIGKAKDKILKFIVLSLVYGMNDYACSLIKIGIDNQIINNYEKAFLERLLLTLKNEININRRIRGTSRMIRIFYYLQKHLNRYTGLYWASSDLEIGNIIDS